MLTTGITERFAVPDEDGAWIEIQLLGWQALEKARQIKGLAAQRSLVEMGDGVLQFILKRDAARDAEAPPPDPDAPDTSLPFDRQALFDASIVAWSYGDTVTPDLTASLDPVTADWLEETITAKYRRRSAKNA